MKKRLRTHQLFSKEEELKVLLMSFSRRMIKRMHVKEIAQFFYNSVIPFNVAKSEEFKRMVELIGRHGAELKPLSYHETRVKYFEARG